MSQSSPPQMESTLAVADSYFNPRSFQSEDPSVRSLSEAIRTSSKPAKTLTFWLVFLSLCISSFLSTFDLTTISTALPTIIADLQKASRNPTSSGGGQTSSAGNYIWVGSAFALTGTAILPWTGGLAQIWGRKAILIGSLCLFAIGSGVCGSTRTLGVMIAGRAIQGIGNGGILSLSDIIIADLVPLSERGMFQGILAVSWAVASAIGPPIGGLVSHHWRWLFYINIPVSLFAIFFVSCFLTTKIPESSCRSKLAQMDWFGNAIVISAMVSFALGTTWGGVRYPWLSAEILVPIILGLILLIAFFIFELRFAKHPTVPLAVTSNATSFFGFVTTFLHGVLTMAVIYILPVYFQACLGANPVRSGVMNLPLAFTIAPFSIISAISIAVTKSYLWQNYLGWALSLIGLTLLSLLKVSSPSILWVTSQLPIGAGLGILFIAPQFPVLAPLEPKWSAQALALFTFANNLGQTFGLVIGEAVFQNGLSYRLPPGSLPSVTGSAISFSDIGTIGTLPGSSRSLVRKAFANSIREVWWALLPFAIAGLLCCLPMKMFKLHDETDETYGVVETTGASTA